MGVLITCLKEMKQDRLDFGQARTSKMQFPKSHHQGAVKEVRVVWMF